MAAKPEHPAPGPRVLVVDDEKNIRATLAVCLENADCSVTAVASGAEAIRRLPADERAALYQRTLANVKSVCASADLALDEYCREQARILREFPECDEGCREIVRIQVGRRGP